MVCVPYSSTPDNGVLAASFFFFFFPWGRFFFVCFVEVGGAFLVFCGCTAAAAAVRLRYFVGMCVPFSGGPITGTGNLEKKT